MTGVLQGMDGTANPRPLKIKSWTIKRLWGQKTMITRIGGTNTHQCASKQDLFDSKIPHAKKNRRWRILFGSCIASWYETHLMLSYMPDVQHTSQAL